VGIKGFWILRILILLEAATNSLAVEAIGVGWGMGLMARTQPEKSIGSFNNLSHI
jgi:hypothetical protein